MSKGSHVAKDFVRERGEGRRRMIKTETRELKFRTGRAELLLGSGSEPQPALH